MPPSPAIIDPPANTGPNRPSSVGIWVALTVAGWHVAFWATGALTLGLATSPAGTVFEGLAEPIHQKLLLASHLRVLTAYAAAGLGSFILAYAAVRLWVGSGPVSRWGLIARTLFILSLLLGYGWLRLAHAQPYFLGPETYDTWYFRALLTWPEAMRERLMFVLFAFLPAVVGVAAAGVYIMEVARWFRTGSRCTRLTLTTTAVSAVLLAGWLIAPHFITPPASSPHGRMNVVMLSSDEMTTAPVTPDAATSQPHLASLAAQSVVLTHMHTPLATSVGHEASLLSGQTPNTHGLQTARPSRQSVDHTLASSPLLPAILHQEGYATAVLGGAGAGAFSTAQGLGFTQIETPSDDTYPAHLASHVYPAHFIIPTWLDNSLGRRLLPGLTVLPGRISPDEVTQRLTAHLDEGALSGTPFFFQAVYSHPEPPHSTTPTPPLQPPVTSPPPPRSFDDHLALILKSLEKNGLRDNTILVVLGRPSPPQKPSPLTAPSPLAGSTKPVDAAGSVDADAINNAPIPVIFHVPGQPFAPGLIRQLTRAFDLAPTLLEVLGLPVDPAMEGVSLVPSLKNPELPLALADYGQSPGFPDELPGPEATASDRHHFREHVQLDPAAGYRLVLRDESSIIRRKIRWLRTNHWHLVFTPASASAEGVDTWQLFDLRSDPDSSRDVKLQNPKVWQSMEMALRRWVDEKKETRITEIFPDGEPPAVVLPGT